MVPIFGPETPWDMPPDPESRRAEQIQEHGETREVGGTEDPRLIPVGDQLYMTYTAYGDIPRLAVARIPIADFVAGIETSDGPNLPWERMGVVHEGWNDKDGYVLPELSDGNWTLYHRIPPDIQAASFREWRLPIEAPGHTLLTPLDDPLRVTYRSREPILVPQQPCELEGWVDRVVFTCGAVPETKDSNEILTRDDGVIVYYGGADEVMCAARARIGDLPGNKL